MKSVPKILLVEDEPHLAFSMQLNLRSEGFDIDHAKTGTEALNLFNTKGPFNLIILDIMIPEPDGFQVAKAIRNKDKHTAIIMLTARASDQDRIQGLEIGADDYITKPFHLKELMLKVKRAVERSELSKKNTSQEKTPEVIECGQYRLNVESLELTTPLAVHSITALEADILSEFMRNQNRVLSRDYLLEKVWGMHGNVETRTVDNFVMRLRKFIETDHTHPKVLESVRGRGYRFKV